jgi:hypothetical protein
MPAPTPKCRLCGKPVPSNYNHYCLICAHVLVRMQKECLPPDAQQSLCSHIRQHGYRCHYTGIPLELKDYTSPWYCDFKYLIPGKPATVVMICALVNAIKAGLSDKDFRYYVFQLDDHRKKHTKFKKRRLGITKKHKECRGCGRPIPLKKPHYCAKCAKIAYRLRHHYFPRQATEGIWQYIRKYGYICYYTGMRLDLDHPKSHWYLSFDHWMPRDPNKLVITSQLINLMKSDLTEKEFWCFIGQLADHWRKGTRVKRIKLKYWSRAQ